MLGAVPKEEVGSAPLTGVHICFHSSSSETQILNAISPFAFLFFFLLKKLKFSLDFFWLVRTGTDGGLKAKFCKANLKKSRGGTCVNHYRHQKSSQRFCG